MESMQRLGRDFFRRPTLELARDLIGIRLVRIEGSHRLSGIIIETEAYCGEQDLGCHARVGITPRTKVMYGPPGFTYVYFTYGMHWLLNFVTEAEGFPAAVLIRSIEAEEGFEIIQTRRGRISKKHWTDGPAKICQALGIDGNLNGCDLCSPDAQVFVECDEQRHIAYQLSVTTSPRVGLYTVPEPWKSIPWRFSIKT